MYSQIFDRMVTLQDIKGTIFMYNFDLYRSGLNNENNKNKKLKLKIFKSKIKDLTVHW